MNTANIKLETWIFFSVLHGSNLMYHALIMITLVAVKMTKNRQKYNELMRIFIDLCARHFRQDLKQFFVWHNFFMC